MGEMLEVKGGSSVSEVVDELATALRPSGIRLRGTASVDKGAWVRFAVALADGTPVIDGVGRCQASVACGGSPERYDIDLEELQFDERNEIMYERIVIAKEASARGDNTGAIKLNDVVMEDVIERAGPRTSSRPPMPPAKSSSRPPTPAPRLPSSRPGRPARSTGGPGASPGEQGAREQSPWGSSRSADAKRTGGKPTAGKTSTLESASAAASAGSLGSRSLTVPASQVARARQVGRGLPAEVERRARALGAGDTGVLLLAIRVGLSTLESLGDDD